MIKKDTNVIWRRKPIDPNEPIISPGGSGVALADEDDGKVIVSVQTESKGDGNTCTLNPPEEKEFPASELVVL